MTTSYKELVQERTKTLGKMHKEMPEFMKAFGAFSHAANADGALDKKMKELITLALAISNHCQGCIGFHVQGALKNGATRAEILDTITMAVYMGGGPSLMYAAEAVDALDEMGA